MNKKVVRSFVEQFGKEWECSCKAPFGSANLEIISESESSLVAHYVCPSCGREQMLAASISGETQMLEENLQTIHSNQISSDDVLDIRQEVKNMKLSSLRNLYRAKVKKNSTQTASRLSTTQ